MGEKTANVVHWAKIHNLKQVAKTVNFLSENGFYNAEKLETALVKAIADQDTTGNSLKALERQIPGNRELMKQISTCRQTKPTHDGLKATKKPQQYREQHRPDLSRYEAAVKNFKEQGLKKLPNHTKLLIAKLYVSIFYLSVTYLLILAACIFLYPLRLFF